MPSTTSFSPSGSLSRLLAFGRVALKPAAISGVTIMKMIRSTSMTSIIGVTSMSALTAPWPALPVDVATASHRLLGLELRGDESFRDTGRDAREAARGTCRSHAGEGVHDTHGGPEEADERRGGTDG